MADRHCCISKRTIISATKLKTRYYFTTFTIFPYSSMVHLLTISTAGVARLCQVTSNLNGLEQHELIMKHKRGTCFRRGHTYYICKFDVRVIVAPADLRFELWFAGKKFSRNHEPVAVAWDEAGSNVGEKVV